MLESKGQLLCSRCIQLFHNDHLYSFTCSFYFLLLVCFIDGLMNTEDTLNVECLASQQRNLALEICHGGRVGSQSAWINTSDDEHTRETQRNEVFVGRVYSSNAVNWLTECASRRIRSPCSYYGKDESNCFLDSYDSLVLLCTQWVAKVFERLPEKIYRV